MTTPVTASMLYDLVSCPHRVTMDLFADPAQRDEPNPFVKLLWERGSVYEREVIEGLEIPFTNLSMYVGDEKERLTLEAMQRGEPLIYSGRMQAEGLLGDPDLLRREGDRYVAGDIKSGAGEEGSQDLSKPKKHYAVQLGLYTDILERKGLSAGKRGFIWDINGQEVVYDFTEPHGKGNPRTLWEDYQDCLAEVQAIVGKSTETLAAYSGVCKLCHWYSACISRLTDANDLTLIPELGRSRRDVMMERVATIRDLAEADPAGYVVGKKTIFPGIGPATLEKLHARAKLAPSFAPDSWPHRVIALLEHVIYSDGLCHFCVAEKYGASVLSYWYGDQIRKHFEPYVDLLLRSTDMDLPTATAEAKSRLSISRWVREDDLCQLVAKLFPNTTIRREASPPWLGQQRLDIYIPDLALAIEHQGEQHYRPIGGFGGEEGFAKARERDERKSSLCLANGVTIVEVRFDDPLTLPSLRSRLRRWLTSSGVDVKPDTHFRRMAMDLADPAGL